MVRLVQVVHGGPTCRAATSASLAVWVLAQGLQRVFVMLSEATIDKLLRRQFRLAGAEVRRLEHCTDSLSNSSRLGISSIWKGLKPVRLPPGRARLATSP